MEQEPAAPRGLRPELDRDLETVCLKCLEKQPERRYASAEALAEDLERWLRGEPIAARPVGTRERVVKWMRRHPAIAVTTAAFVVVVLVAASLVTLQWREAVAARSHAEQQRQQAELARTEAESARTDAEQKKQAAEAAQQSEAWLGQAEKRARLETERQLERAEIALYVNRLARAQRAIQDHERHLALEQLDECPWDLRGWEWHHLRRQARPERVILRGPVAHICFSPDGRRLAGVGSEGTVCVWDAVSGEQVLQLKGRPDKVTSVCYSPDGRRLASTGWEGIWPDTFSMVRIWDAIDGALLQTLRNPTRRHHPFEETSCGLRMPGPAWHLQSFC